MKKHAIAASVALRLALAAAICTLAAASALAADDAAQGVQARLIKQGEYLSRAGDCIACHTAKGGKPYAGGLGIDSPLGVIYSTNITPDKDTGIGNYSYEDFDRALRRGVARDGHSLYPAMPYTSYAYIKPDDVKALYAYFMHGVTPVKQAKGHRHRRACCPPARRDGSGGAARTPVSRAASGSCRRRFPARAPARAGCPATPQGESGSSRRRRSRWAGHPFGDEDRLRACSGPAILCCQWTRRSCDLLVQEAVGQQSAIGPGPAVGVHGGDQVGVARIGLAQDRRIGHGIPGVGRAGGRRAFDKGRRASKHTHDAAPVRSRFDYSRHCDLGGLARIHPSCKQPAARRFSWARLPVYSTQGVSMTDPQSQPSAPMLHFLCGKIGAGKSTLAAALASQPGALRISEDDWLAALYPGEIHGMDDYVRCAGRLRAVVAPCAGAAGRGSDRGAGLSRQHAAQPCMAARAGGGVGARMPHHGRAHAYAMPGFDWRMTDEVAAVVSFVRSSWGNQAGAVSASDVAKVRETARRRSLCVDPGPFAGGASGRHSAGAPPAFRTLATDSAAPVWPGSVRRPRGRRARHALSRGFQLQHGVQVAVQRGVQAALGGGQRAGRQPGHGERDLARMRVDAFRRQDVEHDAHVAGFFGIEFPGRVRQFLGALQADDAGQGVERAAVRDRAQAQEGQAEARAAWPAPGRRSAPGPAP